MICYCKIIGFLLFSYFRVEPGNEFYDGDKDNDKENDAFLDV